MFTIMLLENKMSVFEILNLRSEWENIARNLNTDIDSSISGLESFISYSYKSNRFKSGWKEAMEIAERIVDYSK